jgi:hypothetical protein
VRNAALVAKPLKKVALRGSSPHPTTKTTTMKYKDFKDVIQTLDYQAKTENSLYKLNVDLYSHSDGYNKVIELLMSYYFGKEGCDWITWFCYENDFGRNKYEATDKGKLICQDIKSLWEFINQLKK